MDIKKIVLIGLVALVFILVAKNFIGDKKSKKKLLQALIPILVVIGGLVLYPSDDIYQAVLVTKVADGDTISVKKLGESYKVRMIGVNTRELSHYGKPEEFYAREAAEFTEKNLLNRVVYLQKDTSDTDQYDRLLRYVWLEKPSSPFPSKSEIENKMYNAILVKEAYAEAKAYPPDTSYKNIFEDLEEEPRSNKEGMWQKSVNASSEKKKDDKDQNLSEKESKGKIKGNKNSKIYHVPGQKNYDSMKEENVVYFDSEKDAEKAGYRKAKN